MATSSAHWASRLNQALFLIPVIVLTGIAIAGLLQYRHSITAQAQADARRWVSDADRLLGICFWREALGVARWAGLESGEKGVAGERGDLGKAEMLKTEILK